MFDKVLWRIILIYGFAQLCLPVSAQYKYRRFTTSEGLSHDITYQMLQDSLGRLWIGTDDGLDCFDGNKFLQITSYDGLYSNYVIGLCTLPGFKMRIATWGGGSQILDLDQLKVERCDDQYRVKLKNIFYHNDWLLSAPDYVLHTTNLMKSKCDSEHHTIIDGSGGVLKLNKFDPTGLSARIEDYYKFSGAVMDDDFYIFNDPKKTVLKTKPLPGIFKLSVGNDSHSNLIPQFDFAKNKYVSLVTSYKNKIYIAVSDTLYLLKNEQILEQRKLALNGNAITKLSFLSENRYVIITMDANGNKYGYFYDEGKLIDLKQYCNIRNSLSDILIDNDQNIWISSYGDGVFQLMLKKELISYMGSEKFLDPNIFGMAKSASGSMILLSRDYVYEYRDGKVFPQAIDNTCRELKSDRSGNYLFCFDAPQKRNENKYLFKLYENSLLEDIGEVNNFHQYITLNKDTVKINLENGIQIKSLAKINDDLFWLADLQALYKISVSKKAILETVPFDISMCSNKITKLLHHNNKLFIATDRCLMQYANGVWKRLALERSDEIIAVNDMVIPDNGDLWVASQQGLYRLNDAGVFKLDKSSGLLNDYVKSVCLDDSGKLWAATNNGVNIVDIQNLATNKYPHFNIKQDFCIFNIYAISLEKPTSVITQYQLDNDSKWENVINGKIEFCNLKYGKHSVKFQTRLTDNNWLSSKSYDFEIKAPWHQTVAGFGVILLLSVAFIGFLSLYVVKRLKQRNKYLGNLIVEKERLQNELNNSRNTIAKDFHDDLGNKMARISIMSELLINENNVLDSKIKRNLEQIKMDADVLYKNTRDFIWSLSTESNELYEIDLYLCDFAEGFFENLEIRFDVKRDYDQQIKIPYHWSRHIILIFKEIMTNAAKHAQCSDVVFEIKESKGALTLSFKDNGIGLPADAMKSNNGIKNVISRTVKINGKSTFTNLKGGGCEFALTLLIPNVTIPLV